MEGSGILEKLFPKPMEEAPRTREPEPTPAVITVRTQTEDLYEYLIKHDGATLSQLIDKFLKGQDTEENRGAMVNSLSEMVEEGWIEKLGEDRYAPRAPSGISSDLIKNNIYALSMARKRKLTKEQRDQVNSLYNGLGVEYAGTMGRIGLAEKREVTLQQFYTDPAIASLIVYLMQIPEGATVFDPSCGAGRLLYAMPNHRLCHGIEIEEKAYTIAKAIMPEAQIIQSSSMYHIFEEPTFDYVVTNPPFSIMWEDELRRLKFTSASNRVPSHIATLEICAKALKQMGCLAAIVPNSTMKVISREADFWEWFVDTMYCWAAIDLPSNWYKTAGAQAWGCTLYLFVKIPSRERGRQTPFDDGVTHLKLEGLDRKSIDKLCKEWDEQGGTDKFKGYADSLMADEETREPIRFKFVNIQAIKATSLLGVSEAVTKEDVITLDVENPDAFDSFRTDFLKPVPNGLGASGKIANIAAYYPPAWSAVREAYVDIFRRDVLPFSNVIAGRMTFDGHPAIKAMRAYDMSVVKSKGMEEYLVKKAEWFKLQECPFEHWADSMLNGQWVQHFADIGLKASYPEIYTQQAQRFEDLSKKYPFLSGLRQYQKEDALKLTIKASAIDIGTMGTGKTRKAIAVALLKGFDHNLIVCPQRLIPNWCDEFELLGLEAPHILEYEEDIKDANKHRFCIVGYTTLARPPRKMAPGAKRARERAKEEPEENPRRRRGLEPWVGASDMDDLADLQAYNDLMRLDEGAIANPEEAVSKEAEKAIEKAEASDEEKILRMRMRLFFSDKIKGFDFVMVDEAHYLSNPTTARTNAVAKLEARQWLFMTGTPIQNRILGLFSLLDIGWGRQSPTFPYSPREWMTDFMTFVDGDKKAEIEANTLKKNFDPEVAARVVHDLNEVYVETMGHKGGRKKERAILPLPIIRNPDKLRALMAGKWLRRSQFEPEVQRDVAFVRPNIETVAVEADEETVKYYARWIHAYKNFFGEWKEYVKGLGGSSESEDVLVSSGEYDEDEPGVGEFVETPERAPGAPARAPAEEKKKVGCPGLQAIGVLQIASLMPQYEGLNNVKWQIADHEPITMPKAYKGKIPTARQRWILDHVTEWAKAGKKCYIVCHFKMFIDYLKGEFTARGVKALGVSGEVDIDERKAILKDFADSKNAVLLGTSGVLDVGLNIPSADICIIAAPEWNWSTVSQTIGRMLRGKSTGDKKAYILYEKGSIEYYVKSIMEMKKSSMDEVEDRVMVEREIQWVSWIALMMTAIGEMEKGIIR